YRIAWKGTAENSSVLCGGDDDRVLATANGENPKWYPITEQHNEDTGEWEQGFMFGSFFVPFSQVLRV
ncbi:MAG: hypothetical protein LUF27_02530, partial [Lachnospiraceae bacterium]|nr:hypothetical protein [Lachnospiraceae bacterium]